MISDPKRLKLLMMVFKYDNAKTESVAVEKMITWWHFVLKMGQKLSVNFEKVISPHFLWLEFYNLTVYVRHLTLFFFFFFFFLFNLK